MFDEWQDALVEINKKLPGNKSTLARDTEYITYCFGSERSLTELTVIKIIRSIFIYNVSVKYVWNDFPGTITVTTELKQVLLEELRWLFPIYGEETGTLVKGHVPYRFHQMWFFFFLYFHVHISQSGSLPGILNPMFDYILKERNFILCRVQCTPKRESPAGNVALI